MLTSELEFLNASLSFPELETNPTATYTVMTIVIDGVPYVIEESGENISNVGALIATINDSVVRDLVQASAAQDPDTNEYYFCITARGSSITSIDVIDDPLMIFNRVKSQLPNGVTGDVITKIASIQRGNITSLDQLEPKNEGLAATRVYLPMHTHIVSDAIEVDTNFWATYTHSMGDYGLNKAAIPSSIVCSVHPDTGEPILYSLYVQTYVDAKLIIECRYATGSKGGQLVSGITNSVSFHPIPNNPIFKPDRYSIIESATLAVDQTTGTLYIKSIFTTDSDSGCVVLTKFDNTLNFDNVLWTKIIALDLINGDSHPIYLRSDGGLVVDGDGNLIVGCNFRALGISHDEANEIIAIPAFELMKINGQTGNTEWSKKIASDKLATSTQGPIHAWPLQSVVGNWWKVHYPIPACIDVNANGDIYVGHAGMLHKFNTSGANCWSKLFPTVRYDDLTPDGLAYQYISGVQTHPTNGDVFVAVGGAPVHNADGDEIVACATVYKINDGEGSNVTNLNHAFRFNKLAYARPPMDSSGQYAPLCESIIIKLDVSTNTLYAATKLHHRNDDVAAGMTIAKINADTMQLMWSYDASLTQWMGIDCQDNANPDGQYQLDGPASYFPRWWYGGNGYTNFDFVYNDDRSLAGICYCVPMGVPNSDSVPSRTVALRGGWLVVHSPNIPPIGTGRLSNVSYAHIDNTSLDDSINRKINRIISPTQQVVINGAPVYVSDDQYTVRSHLLSEAIDIITQTPARMRQVSFSLPPIVANVTPSLNVANIAQIGELQLRGLVSPPTNKIGSVFDKKGSFRVGNEGIFYCGSDYDGSTPIWKSISFDGAKFRSIPPGMDPNNSDIITGGPADNVGDLYITSSRMILMCVSPYTTGTEETWIPLNIPSSWDIIVTHTIGYSFDYSNTEYWPEGAYLTSYFTDMTISPDVIPADIVGGYFGKPAAGIVITRFVAPRNMWISDKNINNGLWKCVTAPSKAVTLTIRINGSTLGTIRFAAGKTTGIIESGGWGRRDVSIGDVISVVAPSSQDNTFADVHFTIVGGLRP